MSISELQKDLQRIITGEVLTDLVSREVYATGASIYRLVPLAVVRPRSAEDVAALVEFASSRGIPLTARGSGTGVAGQSLGEGIIIDFRTHLNRIISVDPDSREAVVEPGVIHGALNRELKKHSLIFPPDPSSGDYITLGGMIANNSSGPHSMKHGDTRAWTKRLKAVLSDANISWIESKPPMPAAAKSSKLENKLYAVLPRLLSQHRDAIERSRPRVSKNSSGYHVWDLADKHYVNPVPLLVGSEGTLAITVKAVLKLMPLPQARAVMLLAFSDLSETIRAVAEIKKLGPAAIEIMDRLFIDTVRAHRADLRELLPEKAEAVLLIEFEAETGDQAGENLFRVEELFKSNRRGKIFARVAKTPAEEKSLWEIRKAASPILYRLPGKRLTRFVEDVVIPPERLDEGITRIREILASYGTEAPILGHAGDGNLHLNPRLDLTDPAERQKMAAIASDIYDLVISLGGTISGEHGDGLLRSGFLKRQFPELLPLFTEIKQLFDPERIFNPGKIVTDSEGIPIDALSHEPPAPSGSPGSSLRDPRALEILYRCHGCGLCRTYCPVAEATGDELVLPRSKLSLLRAIALGEINPDDVSVKEDLEKALALCTACQRCLTGCPTGIETADLIIAFLSEHYSRHGRRLREKIFALAPAIMAAGSKTPALSAASNNAVNRFFMETILGLRRDAPWPKATRDTIPGIAERPAAQPGARRVIYYPGCLGRYADESHETRDAVEVLEALGFEVLLPPLSCCGEPLLVAHDREGARAAARKLIGEAQKEIAAGAIMVTACPGCALTIRHTYPIIIGEEALTISRRTEEFFRFVSSVLVEKNFTLDAPLRAVYHRSCHQAALGAADPVAQALARISGLGLIKVEDACCGLAGNFGMKVEQADVSNALAKKLVDACAAADTRAVVSSCPGCRMQIRHLGFEPVSAVGLILRALKK